MGTFCALSLWVLPIFFFAGLLVGAAILILAINPDWKDHERQ